MPRKLRSTTLRDEIEIAIALDLLRNARDRLRAAGAHNAARSVRRSLKSVDGARRHARRASQ